MLYCLTFQIKKETTKYFIVMTQNAKWVTLETILDVITLLYLLTAKKVAAWRAFFFLTFLSAKKQMH